MAVPRYDVDLLPEEWTEVAGSTDALELERELTHEIPEGHLLSGRTVKAVAVRKHRKDVLYWLPEDQQWAWVHLTWTVERDTRWPVTVVADDWPAIVAELLA
jgi:hypothetical protein